ncbi:MAG: helix-turn-helix transcriptional regulator [Candidatus Lokiarchaeota archaeon]|nr:helix-turn-helix transcriptional regulator [Candidatus Lokiarchaeota archaeon]
MLFIIFHFEKNSVTYSNSKEMWPKGFKFFIDFSEDLKTIFIFNTVKNFPEGLTYYDLKKFGNIPHSKIYRMMKDLAEEKCLLIKSDISKETGRPKHLYFLTDKGENKSIDLRQKVGKIFEFINHRFPESGMEFDHEKFLKGATFSVWSSPVEYIMQKDITNEEKLNVLTYMEKDVNGILLKIRKEKQKLQKIFNMKKEE